MRLWESMPEKFPKIQYASLYFSISFRLTSPDSILLTGNKEASIMASVVNSPPPQYCSEKASETNIIMCVEVLLALIL